MKTTRRDFIGSAAVLASAKLLPAADPALRFPTTARERLAMASYSLRSMLSAPRRPAAGGNAPAPQMDIKDFPAFVVQRFNLHNVEILGQHLRSTESAYLTEFRDACRKAGVHVVNIPTGVGASVYDPDAGRRSVAIENAKKWIDTAGVLECPSVRIHIQRAANTQPDPVGAAESLGSVAQYGAMKGVVVNLENDDPNTEDAFFITKIIDQVKSPWLRALPDFCNSMLKGDEKFNYEAVAAMFQRAYNISHLKDAEVDGNKVYRVDLARTFAIAKESGYKGYYSVEFEGEGDPVTGAAKLVEAALQYLS